MASVLESPALRLGPHSNGVLLTPGEFDGADFEEGWRYELIRGVLIVSPAPLREERDPNEELGRWLRNYQEDHPDGKALDATVSEETIHTSAQRRRGDRVIWSGLGRLPGRHETPTIVVEFVSSGRRNRDRDYEEKRDEYLAIGVREYWIIDRFSHSMTVYFCSDIEPSKRVVPSDETYVTPLLPGFELPLARLFELADRWDR